VTFRHACFGLVANRLISFLFVMLCRWDVARLNSKKTCVFKPSPLDPETARDALRRQLLGGVYSGDYQKVPRANKRVGLVWEAGS
jgi:hypothetical protein